MADGVPSKPEDVARVAAEQTAQMFAFNLQLGKAFMDAWGQALAQAQRSAEPTARATGPVAAWPTPSAWPGWPATTPPLPSPSPTAFADATRIWINAVGEATRRTQEAVQKGQPIAPDAFVDVWTKAASELSQAVVSDAAFAALTGQWVNAVSKAKVDAKKAATNQIREVGFATHEDVEEVGKRLIELERRVHDLLVLVEDGAKNGKPASRRKAE